MKDVLLEYVMKVSTITPTPAASLEYLHRVLCIVPPETGVTENEISLCTKKSEIEELTPAKCGALLDAGLSSVYILPASSLDLDAVIDAATEGFYTSLIDPSFTDLSALDLGSFDGVVGWTTATSADAEDFAKEKNNVAFYDLDANAGKNMYHAFGKLLSASSWRNQQYIEMPETSEIEDLGTAETLFSKAVSFVLTSPQYGKRLGLFASNKRAVVAPYIYEEIRVRLQSTALRYISGNQPNYTISEASLLEDVLQSVIDEYVAADIIESGNITVSPSAEQFVLKAEIRVAEPKALWRIKADMYQGSV